MSAQTYHFRQNAFRIMIALNIVLLLLAVGLAGWYNTWSEALLIGLPSAIVPIVLYRVLGDHLLSRISFAISFMFFSALHIHQSMGMTEIHFGIFVLLAVLTAFRDWIVIATAAVTIAVHHLLFMYLQNHGSAIYLVPQQDATLSIVVVHAIYVVVESAVLIMICRHSFQESLIRQAFFDTIGAVVTTDGKIILSKRCPEVSSSLVHRFNEMLETLQKTIKTINQVSVRLREEVTNLMNDGTELSNGIKQELNEVERIAAAIEQMSQSIEEVFHLSQQVSQYSEQAEKSALSGQKSVTATIVSIEQLAETLEQSRTKVNDMADSTNDIKTVLDVIQSIAEQTNLLALNAAIEAARAGEQGRGFAVVADEVRTLASRTHGSTDEIKAMIGRLTQTSAESVTVVNQCLQQLQDTIRYAGESGELLKNIATQAQKVSQSVDNMANALQQQSVASNEIAGSAQHLNGLTQEQNKKGGKMLDSASHLEQVTDMLTEKAACFEV